MSLCFLPLTKFAHRIILNDPDTSTTQASLALKSISAVFCSFPAKGIIGAEATETNVFPANIKSTADPTMVFFSMDYGKCS